MGFDITTFLSVILSLIIIEVLLSVDNSLVNAALAKKLPEDQQKRALRLGIIFGAGFRLLALLAAGLIIHNTWVKVLGGLYLIYLAFKELGGEHHQSTVATIKGRVTFKRAVGQIALADLAFGLDNVVTAVGLSSHIEYVITGVMLGIVAMIFLSPVMLKVLKRLPRLGSAAYIIVALIGIIILIEEMTHIHIIEYQKFLVVLSVIAFTLLYERNMGFQRLFRPSVHRVKQLLALPHYVVHRLRK